MFGTGATRHVYYITTDAMNKRLHEFTKSPRPWTAFPADTIEVVAKHNNMIPQNAHYVHFEVEHERLTFHVIEEMHGKPCWIDNARSFISRILGK